MSNPFLLSPKQRLEEWKIFRNAITTLPDYNQLSEIASFWAQAPLSKFAYDPEQPSEWATPWEMIYEGDWCKFSVAIGMELLYDFLDGNQKD